MLLAKDAAKGFAWSALDRVASQLLQFVVLLILAKLLEPDAFGLLAMAAVFVAIGQILVDQGFPEAIVQRKDLTPGDLNTAFWTNLGIGAVLSVGTFSLAGVIAEVYGQSSLALVLKLLSPIFAINSLETVQRALLRRNLAFATLAARNFAAVLAGGSVGVFLALRGNGVFSLVGQYLAGSIAATLVIWQTSRWRPGIAVSGAHFRDMFSYGLTTIGVALVGAISRHLDKFLIGLFVGPTILGYYFIAYRVVEMLTRSLSGVVENVAFPLFSRVQDDARRSRQAFGNAVQASATLSFPIFLGLAAVADDVVPLLLPDEWATTAKLIQVFALAGVTYSVSVVHNAILKANGKPLCVFALAVLSSALTVGLIAIAVGRGVTALAGAHVVRSYLLFPVSLLVATSFLGLSLRDYAGLLKVPVLASIIMLCVVAVSTMVLPAWMPSQIRLIVPVLAGGIAYSLAVWRLDPKFMLQAVAVIRRPTTSSAEQSI